MSRTYKSSTLKQTYYRSFLLLAVIPLVLVFVGAEIVIGYMIRDSGIKTLSAIQENIAVTVSSDVRSNSLQLSHFVYNNNGEFLQAAVRVRHSSGSDWYEADQLLQQAFRTAMVPSYNILAGGFYMKEAGAVYMKDDIALPEGQVRQEDWYRNAVENPNKVVLGCYDTTHTRVVRASQQARQLVLVTAMATDVSSDKSGEIEVVAFFTTSLVGDVIASQQKGGGQGMSVILDGEGHVLFGDMGDDTIRNYFEERAGQFQSGSQTRRAVLADQKAHDYFFLTREIPGTDWYVVTFIEESKLGSDFYRVGSLVALIVAVLLILFYFYSRYFLNAIIEPVQTVCRGMERLNSSDLEVQIEPAGQKEIQELMGSFNQMVVDIRNMLHLTEDTMQKKHEAEIKALQSQINPHFIVNTLNSIRFMAQVAQFDGIRKMAEALVNIVSCSFRSNVSFYTVGEELEMLKTYVYLMRIRYSNGFEVSYDVWPDCTEYMLPRLILQPIVENSITHGFDEVAEELGKIEVSVYREEGFLCMSVWDNGRGMSPEEIELVLRGRTRRQDDNMNIGLENVLARIRLHFGADAGIEIESERDSFTRVTVKLPLSACICEHGEEEES